MAMQLYATATSERASKSQGGNEFLDVECTIDRECIVRVEIDREGDGYRVNVSDASKNTVYSVHVKDKKENGEKKKSEGCDCGNTDCTR